MVQGRDCKNLELHLSVRLLLLYYYEIVQVNMSLRYNFPVCWDVGKLRKRCSCFTYLHPSTRQTWQRSTDAEIRAAGTTWAELRRTSQNRVRWRGVVAALCYTRNQEA